MNPWRLRGKDTVSNRLFQAIYAANGLLGFSSTTFVISEGRWWGYVFAASVGAWIALTAIALIVGVSGRGSLEWTSTEVAEQAPRYGSESPSVKSSVWRKNREQILVHWYKSMPMLVLGALLAWLMGLVT